jgi:hypothetical protein
MEELAAMLVVGNVGVSVEKRCSITVVIPAAEETTPSLHMYFVEYENVVHRMHSVVAAAVMKKQRIVIPLT